MTKLDILLARVAKRYLTRNPRLRSCRHSELSIICSADDHSGPNAFLLEAALIAVQDALAFNLEALGDAERLPDSVYYDVFPGEHYRLLRALAKTFASRSIIEVGTFTGMSSAAMLLGMPDGCSITTFDITSWKNQPSHLREESFSSGRIEQILADLSDEHVFSKYVPLFEQSQIIFCDAPKDGIFEPRFLANLARVKPLGPAILVLDDTRLLNMIDVWRSIASPKLDLTSFGHWSGTGLVDITAGLVLKS